MVLGGLSGTTLFGGAMAAAGALILLLAVRHVWRAGAVLRAPAASERGGDASGAGTEAADTDAAGDRPLVRLEGTVDVALDDEPIETSFGGTPSVVVRHVVSERRLNPNVPFLPWSVTVREDTASVPFEVRTPATTATVDGNVGTAILDPEPVATVAAGESPPDRILAYDAEAGLDDARSPLAALPGPLAGLGRRLGLGRRTYSEERLEPGDEATVVGYPVGDGVVDPLVVSDGTPRRTFLSMARTGLGTGVLGAGVLAFGAVLVLLG